LHQIAKAPVYCSSVADADQNTGIPHFESKYRVEQYLKNLGISYSINVPAFLMENLLGAGLREGQRPLPLSPSRLLQQIALGNTAEFSPLVPLPYIGVILQYRFLFR
jgi:uncharacterized protein YbjT (DUF2867 family)